MNRKHTFHLLMLTLTLSTLACTLFVGGPEIPTPPIPVSTEAAESIKEQVRLAIEGAVTTGTVTLQINESQLTSLLAIKLASQSNPLMTEPQVLLRDGQMLVYGKVQRGIFVANVSMVINVGVDEAGQPKIEVASADFGPLPAPEGLNTAISALVAEAYTGSLGPIATGFRMESITITHGLMTLSGRVK
jgi:hypothetical protein